MHTMALVFLIFVIPFIKSEVIKGTYYVHTDNGGSHSVNETVAGCRSRVECAAVCDQSSWCDIFSYDKTTNVCSLSSSNMNSATNGQKVYRKQEIQATEIQATEAPTPKVASGKTFVLGFFLNVFGSTLISYDLMIATESPTGASVTITTPLYDPSYIKTANIAQDQAVRIILDTTHNLAVSAVGIESKGILVESTEVISVYGLINEDSTSDGFTVIPTKSLGMEYYATTWNSRSDILVVSTADGTDVDITFPPAMGAGTVTYNAVVYAAGDTLSITLDKFQTFNVYGSGTLLLTGTHIVANKPVSVLSGSQCDSVGSGGCDVLIQHILPVQEWGTEYFTIQMPSTTQANQYQIVASQSNTDIYVNGVYDSTITLAGGNVVKFFLLTEYKTITTSKPTMVTMYSPGKTSAGGDPHMVILTSTAHFAATFSYLTPKMDTLDYTNYIAIVVRDSDQGGIRLDGSSLVTTKIASIEGSGGMVVMEADVTPGAHILKHNDISVTFGAYAFGVYSSVSYGFFLT